MATVVGMITLLATASGVFGEMQSALNAIWKAKPAGTTVSRLIRARAASLGLVATLGFLLLVSLVVSAGLTAFGNYLNAILPFGKLILSVLNGVISVLLTAVLFAAIYKVLPDRRIAWRDVLIGAVVTAILFTIGKSLIGWYIGSSAVASSFGAAGALIVLLLWIYYSALIFLFGAEFTKIYANRRGSMRDEPVAETPADAAPSQSSERQFAASRKRPPEALALAGAQSRASAEPPSQPWLAILWIIAGVKLLRELRQQRRSRRA
jgi:membrane protein